MKGGRTVRCCCAERERLSTVLAETNGAVFRDEEFITHLERVADTEDDLADADVQCSASRQPAAFPPKLRVERVQGTDDVWEI